MKIVLLGSGNVATHLGHALVAAKHHVSQVYSRRLPNAVLLAEMLSAQPIDDISAIDVRAEIYILALKDDAIDTIVAQMPLDLKGLVVHTSGTTSIDILQPLARYGVFYPLQTFSKFKAVNFRAIPIALEYSKTEDLSLLESLARSISDSAFLCNSRQRLSLHVAAVFACNFTNHLYAIAAHLLERDGLSFDLIKPLIAETAEKVQSVRPEEAQTGPAVRGDQKTLNKHIAFLCEAPEWLRLYELLSQDIQKRTE